MLSSLQKEIKSIYPYDLKEKNVLLIGNNISGLASEIKKLGGTPYACSRSKSALDNSIEDGGLDKDKAFHCNLQDLPKDLIEKFHVIVVYHLDIFPFAPDFSETFSAFCKGIANIGVEATTCMRIMDLYLEEPAFSKIAKIIQEHFGKVSMITQYNSTKNMEVDCTFICDKPGERSLQQPLLAPNRKGTYRYTSTESKELAFEASPAMQKALLSTPEELRNVITFFAFLARHLKEEQKEKDMEDQLPKR